MGHGKFSATSRGEVQVKNSPLETSGFFVEVTAGCSRRIGFPTANVEQPGYSGAVRIQTCPFDWGVPRQSSCRPRSRRLQSRLRKRNKSQSAFTCAAKRETAKPAASQSTRTATAAAAPSDGPSPSDWRSQVIGVLERNKRYPPGAESNHEEGTAHLAFTIDRQGRVTSAHIAGSSGSAALDAETLALVHRVSIPPPPAEMAGAQISLVVSQRCNIPRY